MFIKDKVNEIWTPITGYEGKYEISNLGRIRSYNFYKVGREKVLEHTAKNGYIKVALKAEGKKKWYWIHRLMAIAFLSSGETLDMSQEIDHKDGNRQNNYIDCKISDDGEIIIFEDTSNLRWCTHKQNMNNEHTREKISNAMKLSWKKRKSLLEEPNYS